MSHAPYKRGVYARATLRRCRWRVKEAAVPSKDFDKLRSKKNKKTLETRHTQQALRECE